MTDVKGRVRLLLALMRQSAAKSETANGEWNRLNDAFDQKHRDEDQRADLARRPHKTDHLRRGEKEASFALSDYSQQQKWHREQTMFYAAQIQAEIAAASILPPPVDPRLPTLFGWSRLDGTPTRAHWAAAMQLRNARRSGEDDRTHIAVAEIELTDEIIERYQEAHPEEAWRWDPTIPKPSSD